MLSKTVPTDTEKFKEYLKEMLKDPEMCRVIHLYSDKDKSKGAQHHTIGNQPNQAASN